MILVNYIKIGAYSFRFTYLSYVYEVQGTDNQGKWDHTFASNINYKLLTHIICKEHMEYISAPVMQNQCSFN